MDEFIWYNEYVIKLIKKYDYKSDKVLERIILDNKETWDNWKTQGDDIYESMIQLTEEQIELCENYIQGELFEHIWDNEYVTKLIKKNNFKSDKVLERIILDNKETWDNWKTQGDDIYESMIQLTEEQIEFCEKFINVSSHNTLSKGVVNQNSVLKKISEVKIIRELNLSRQLSRNTEMDNSKKNELKDSIVMEGIHKCLNGMTYEYIVTKEDMNNKTFTADKYLLEDIYSGLTPIEEICRLLMTLYDSFPLSTPERINFTCGNSIKCN